MNKEYVVKRGDTLYGISNQYGVSVTELAELNGVTANTLKVGDVLIIPIKSGVNPDNMFMYTVKKGDTLYSIARIYHTSVNEIKKLNYLTSNQLYLGQVLRIPEVYTKPEEMYLPEYENYQVKKGDSLYSISKKFGVSIELLMQDNALTSQVLVVGQNLRIRKNNSGEILECYGEEYNLSNNFKEYIVVLGDTLYSIAKKFGVSVNDLIKNNNLVSTNLTIGQVLKIPNNNSIIYSVKKGDSLYSIAKKYGVSVEYIKKNNKLINNNLEIGQQLII